MAPLRHRDGLPPAMYESDGRRVITMCPRVASRVLNARRGLRWRPSLVCQEQPARRAANARTCVRQLQDHPPGMAIGLRDVSRCSPSLYRLALRYEMPVPPLYRVGECAMEGLAGRGGGRLREAPSWRRPTSPSYEATSTDYGGFSVLPAHTPAAARSRKHPHHER